MGIHTSPRQCLENLIQREAHGGREEFLEQQRRFMRAEPERPTGDCAVVALVHAAFRPPTGQSYREARQQLLMSIRPWMCRRRKRDERRIDFIYRRFKEFVRPPRPDPIHETPSDATSSCLRIFYNYELIYASGEGSWYCICDMKSTYVLNVQIPGGHTMTVHQRVAYTTAPFDPHGTDVVHVYRLNHERTRNLKAWGSYHEAVRLWDQQWLDADFDQLPDWDDRPKMEDYMNE